MTNAHRYPESFLKFPRKFSTEKTCEDYLFKLRWPKGFICPHPHCQDTEFYYLNTRRAFKCKKNGHQTFLTAGTAMQGSRTPLVKWFLAAYLITSAKMRISALELHQKLDIRYETAFNILHKFRALMKIRPSDKISGIIEMDDTRLGGPKIKGKAKKGKRVKDAIIIVAVERDKDGRAGGIRLGHINLLSQSSVRRFVETSVELNSTIKTKKRFNTYGDLNNYGYIHEPTKTGADPLPLVSSVISELKNWITDTFHGVSPKHLQAYLNEFAFITNRTSDPSAAFHTILGLSLKRRGPTYRDLYDGA